MAEIVYVLCTLTSGLCSMLLLRGYRASRARLLFWSGLCFAGLAVNNALLFTDLVIVTYIDLSIVRAAVSLSSLMVLIFGLIWEGR